MKLGGLETGGLDLLVNEDGGLLRDDTLESAIYISLFTNARARADDVIPDAREGQNKMTLDRQGWAGDAVTGDRIGSRLWLLNRAKQTEETRQRAIEYVQEALEWIIDDKLATHIDVKAEWHGIGRLDLWVGVYGAVEEQFYFKDILGKVYGI